MHFPLTDDSRQLLINGEWRRGRDRRIDVLNPSTNKVLFGIHSASAQDVNEAVEAAWVAFREGPWGRIPGSERGRFLARLAALMRERVDILAELETRNVGIPIRESRFEVVSAARHLEYFAGLAGTIEGTASVLPTGRLMYTLREPYGVIGQCVPWNSPLKLMARGCAAALACGNTLVMKPSVIACASVLHFGKLLEEAGFPKGVVNIVAGPGSSTGTALVSHPGLRKIVFIGGSETGPDVLAAAGRNVTPAVVELGGKAPIIVTEDVDVDEAVDGVKSQAFARKGEVCFAGTRLFLPQALHDDFIARLVRKVAGVRIGDAMDEATEMGPLISRAHLQKVLDHVDAAIAEGAELVPGGGRLMDPSLPDGNFMRPTILTGVKQSMRVAQEEIFGPVLAVLRYTDLSQAVRDANATEFGLAGYIWARDIRVAHRLASVLECGNVFINTYRYESEVPFGGYKRSGIGREHGLEALREYTQLKTVVVGHDRWRDAAAGR